MEYIAIRKDLTDGRTNCAFCNRPLNSLKAYVLKHKTTGELVLSGPTCAKNNIEPSFNLNSIPDYTKFTSALEERENNTKPNTNRTNNISNDTNDQSLKIATEYIVLRQEKLNQYFNIFLFDFSLFKHFFALSSLTL